MGDRTNLKKIRVDIGLSYCAPCSFYWLSVDPNLTVYAFEPDPKNINSIKAMQYYETYKKNFHLFEMALSDIDGNLDFYSINNGDPGCGSLYSLNSNLRLGYDKITVDVKKSDYIFKKLAPDEIIELIKIDTQGNDYKIIKGFEQFLDKLVFLDVELSVNQYNLDHDFIGDKLINFITSKNFTLLKIENDNGRFINNNFISDVEAGLYTNHTIYPFA
jgi:FkbM family methyltransferase